MYKYMDTFYERKLQTIPKNHAAMICIASPIVKALKLNTHDVLFEQLDSDGRIIITKRHEQYQDGDGQV